MQNQTNVDDGPQPENDDGDLVDICTHCGSEYNPESEGHTELNENEEETGNFFCSPECEMYHYRGGANHGLL